MAVRENSLNEGLSSPYMTMGLSKLNPPSLCSANKELSDNECTMGLLKPKGPIILAHECPPTYGKALGVLERTPSGYLC